MESANASVLIYPLQQVLKVMTLLNVHAKLAMNGKLEDMWASALESVHQIEMQMAMTDHTHASVNNLTNSNFQ